VTSVAGERFRVVSRREKLTAGSVELPMRKL
jgi:hypothetical protein